MKVLKGTLTFVLGMIIGIILFVLAIGGTVVALGMAFKVGQLQEKFTDAEIISHESDVYDQTVLDAVKSIIGDFQNFDQLSLEKLYQHYGIAALNGIGGLDFKDRDFYSAPIKDIMGDFSIIVNSFTLRDVSTLTGNDFESYNLPILTDNLDNNVKGALDNILGSIKGDLTVRTIKTKLIPDFNIENDLIKALQDIPFSSFGSAINAFKLCTFLDVNTDTFVPKGSLQVFVKADVYEEVSKADLLQKKNFVPADGVELYSADAIDTDDDGKTDRMVERELRFVKKVNGDVTSYVVDNSCYGDDFDANATETKFYRHIEYAPYSTSASYPAGTEFFVKGYANRITTFSNDAPGTFEIYFKGFMSLKDLFVEEGLEKVELNSKVNAPTINVEGSLYKKGDDYVASSEYTVKDETIKKNSKLIKKDFESTRAIYLRVHEGTSKPLLQSFAYLSLAELQDMDDFVDNVTVGEVIEVTDSSSAILKALKDTRFGDISTKVDTLRIDEVIEINDSSSLLMKSLKARGCTINELSTVVDDMTLDEVIEIVYDKFTESATGGYVFIESGVADNYVRYNENLHAGMTRYSRSRENEEDPYVYTADENGDYVKNGYYTKYVEADHLGMTRYEKDTTITNASSVIMQALALRECKINKLGTVTDDLCMYEIIDMTKDDTAHIMKSLAKKDCKVKDLGTVVDTMEIGEVIEINDSSSLIMKSLNNHHAKINELGTVVDDMYIDEVIEIKDDSSILMKSLKNRKCKIKDLGKVTDDLSLAEAMEIKLDNFVVDANGTFVCVEDAETYIPYDEVKHAGWTRFVKVDDVWEEYDEFDPDHEGLVQFVHGRYYTLYNPAVHTSYSGDFYVREEVEGSSSKVLQRFANTTLGKFTDAFKTLILGDVMKIDADKYAEAESAYITAHPDEQYFYYDSTDGIYLIATAQYRTDHSTDTFYRIVKTGKDKKIIKKLAYAKVDNLSSAIDKIMDDMFLSDLIDIYDNYQVVETTDEIDDNSKFLLLHDGEVYNEKHVVFVYDGSGKYIKSPVEYVPATDTEKGTPSDDVFDYVSVPNDPVLFANLMASGNVYYLDNTEYIHNISLCTYVFYSGTSAQKANLYYRDAGVGSEVFTSYDGSNLYVNVLGSYVAYDANNPAHSDMTIYALHTSTTAEGYQYYVRLDDNINLTVKESAGEWIPCSAADPDAVYIFTAGSTLRYAMQYCEDVYVEADDGLWVFFDGKYVEYDSSNPDHVGLVRSNKIDGFVATRAQAYYKTGTDTYATALNPSPIHVNVTQEKSSAVLRMMKAKKVTMKNMGKVVADAKIDDLMDVAPNSIFDQADIRNSTIDNLGTVMSNMMNTMTIGDLLDWANITEINANVRSAIAPATLTSFFKSLTYHDGAVTVDMLKLYGIE